MDSWADVNSEQSLAETHQWAHEVLQSVDEVLGLFDPASEYEYQWMSERHWKAMAYLLDLCHSWRDPNDPFPTVFSATQRVPIECCGIVEPNAHWLTWILARRIFGFACEAISPGSTLYGDPDFSEDDYTGADWEAISRAVRLDYRGCDTTLGPCDVARLQAVLDQEYERAVALVRESSKAVVESADGADKMKLFPKGVPDDPYLVMLAEHMRAEIEKPQNKQRSQNELAREITREKKGKDTRAQTLLRTIRRMRKNGEVNL